MNNILKGRLIQWDSKKGFGFIHPHVGSGNIFIHISDFQDKNYRPIIGDMILYKIGQGKDNKKKAIYAHIETDNNNVAKEKYVNKRNKNLFSKKRLYLLLFLGIVIIYSSFSKDSIEPNIQKEKIYIEDKDSIEDKEFNKFLEEQDKFLKEHELKLNIKKPTSKNKYRCDGRQHCRQMKSCDEAKYFIKHCPNTKMDGDSDGIPCERQWCGY